MEFKIASTNWSDISDLVWRYPRLQDFGFEIKKTETPIYATTKGRDGTEIKHECDCVVSYSPRIHIDTIEQLLELIKTVGCDEIIINGKEQGIEIYDGCRE